MEWLLWPAVIALAIACALLYQSLKTEREKSQQGIHAVALMLLDQRHIDHARAHFVSQFDPMFMEWKNPKSADDPSGEQHWLLFAHMWLSAAAYTTRQIGIFRDQKSLAISIESHYRKEQ